METQTETKGSSAPDRGRRLLSYEDLRERGITYSKVHLWRMAREGTFPAPLKLSHSRNAWVEAEIDDWFDERVAERDAEVGHA